LEDIERLIMAVAVPEAWHKHGNIDHPDAVILGWAIGKRSDPLDLSIAHSDSPMLYRISPAWNESGGMNEIRRRFALS
jgi:hypothetical protein